jgi:hypothetical protein
MVCVAEMVLQSALTREESRGLHERADFPDEDSKWLKHIIIEKTNEEMSFSFEPVTFPYVRPTEKQTNNVTCRSTGGDSLQSRRSHQLTTGQQGGYSDCTFASIERSDSISGLGNRAR